jgi:hypothetical protein
VHWNELVIIITIADISNMIIITFSCLTR